MRNNKVNGESLVLVIDKCVYFCYFGFDLRFLLKWLGKKKKYKFKWLDKSIIIYRW